jgi:predicted RND superfamily exporter protein
MYLKHANFQDTARLLEEIGDYEDRHLRPLGMRLSFAGDTPVSQTLIRAIVDTQVRSLSFSLVGIFLVTSLMGRSLVWGVLSVLPCVIAVMVNFAVMGWMGIPLGVATSMFSGMTLGIGVDFAIHLLERNRHHRASAAGAEGAAIGAALREAGPAIGIDAAAIALGFGVMMLSQVPANARLGGLVVLSIVNCLIVTLCVLPALLHIGARVRAGGTAWQPTSREMT